MVRRQFRAQRAHCARRRQGMEREGRHGLPQVARVREGACEQAGYRCLHAWDERLEARQLGRQVGRRQARLREACRRLSRPRPQARRRDCSVAVRQEGLVLYPRERRWRRARPVAARVCVQALAAVRRVIAAAFAEKLRGLRGGLDARGGDARNLNGKEPK